MLPSLRRVLASFLAAVLLAGIALAVGPSSASAAGTSAVLNPYEADLVARTNTARVAAGLPALVAKPGLTDLARRWAATMSATGALSHNDNLGSDLLDFGATQWTTAAENVGRGGSSSAVFNAYWNSTEHKANILRTGVAAIGIGATRTSDGKVWDVVVFSDGYDDAYGAGRSTPQALETTGELTAPPTTTTSTPTTTTAPPTTTPRTTTAPPTTTPTTTTPAPAPVTLYKTVYGSSIVRVVGGSPVALSYADWQATGFAPAIVVTSQVVKYSWSPTLYARTTFPGASTPVVESLDGGQWAAMGRPAPLIVPTIAGSTVHRWQTGNEIFLAAPSGELHKLGFGEWLAMGSPSPVLAANQGYLKLTWDSSVGLSANVNAGQGRPIGYGEWAAAQFPAPLQQARFPGDQFIQDCGSSAITYAGPTLFTRVTYQQWQAAGSPTPVHTGRC